MFILPLKTITNTSDSIVSSYLKTKIELSIEKHYHK